jgi:hypothetical protein
VDKYKKYQRAMVSARTTNRIRRDTGSQGGPSFVERIRWPYSLRSEKHAYMRMVTVIILIESIVIIIVFIITCQSPTDSRSYNNSNASSFLIAKIIIREVFAHTIHIGHVFELPPPPHKPLCLFYVPQRLFANFLKTNVSACRFDDGISYEACFRSTGLQY